MSLVLYDLDHSPFAARVRIAIRAKGLDVTVQPPPDGVRSAAYRRVNPLGLVPALATEQGVILESEVIMEYLEDRFPAPPLRPAAGLDRAKARILARLADFYLAPALKTLFEETKRAPDGAAVAAQGGAVLAHLQAMGTFLAGGPYAVGGALSTADCALAPLLFFTERCRPLLSADPFAAAPWAAYWPAVAATPHVAPVLAELAAAQARRAAARQRGEPED